MGIYLDLDDVAADNPVAKKQLSELRDSIDELVEHHKQHHQSSELHAYNALIQKENITLRVALEAILKEPYGCPFCDSGKLRPSAIEKGHASDCGYELAHIALEKTKGETC